MKEKKISGKSQENGKDNKERKSVTACSLKPCWRESLFGVCFLSRGAGKRPLQAAGTCRVAHSGRDGNAASVHWEPGPPPHPRRWSPCPAGHPRGLACRGGGSIVCRAGDGGGVGAKPPAWERSWDLPSAQTPRRSRGAVPCS